MRIIVAVLQLALHTKHRCLVNFMNHIVGIAFLFSIVLFPFSSSAQISKLDALFASGDTTAVMDSLLKDFDAYLDSLSKPQSYFSLSLGVGTGIFSYLDDAALNYQVKKKTVFFPEMSYFHKSGLGVTVSGFLLNEKGKLNAYKYAIGPTYHLLKPNKYSFDVGYSRYYTNENLSFFTTPIKNEIYGSINIKKWWLEPGIVLSYGWGTKTSFESQQTATDPKQLKTSKNTIIVAQYDESVRDLSLLYSLKHTFLFSNVLIKNDLLSLKPVVLLSAGTQNLGINTSFTSDFLRTKDILPVSSTATDVHKLDFQSSAFVIQLDYSLGKYYFMPQLMLDYYLHIADKRFNSVYSLTTGVNF